MKWLGTRVAAAAIVGLASMSAASVAEANVRRTGEWPSSQKTVTLDLKGVPRATALEKLADAAGWSLVVKTPPGDTMNVHVTGQPADRVLDVILSDGDYVASYDRGIVMVAPDAAPATSASVAPAPASASAPSTEPSAESSAAAPPTPPPPPTPPGINVRLGKGGSEIDEPHARGKDRTVMGGNIRIAKGESARDVTVFGGNVEIEGEVTGDVSVFGGNVHLHDGSHVRGDATVFGGALTLDGGSRVDGDVGALGGHVDRKPGAVVGGAVSTKGGDDSGDDADESPPEKPLSFAGRVLERITDGMRFATLLFVIGTVLIALAGQRMEKLRGEVAARPMRTIALGLLGLLVSIFVVVALCVTVIGIPVAIVGLMLGVFSVFGGMCAVLSVVGEGLLRHKTKNPYVHLAVGCLILVVLSWIPWIGGVLVLAAFLAGIGVLFATRLGGMIPRRNGVGGGGAGAPYRAAA